MISVMQRNFPEVPRKQAIKGKYPAEIFPFPHLVFE